MHLRRYQKSDIPQIAQLYYDTIHQVNSKDYSPSQIQAWAPRVYPTRFWATRFQRYTVYVVEQDGQVVGFSEFEKTGHIDCFYVHHAWQGKGVGSQLMDAIKRQALQRRLRRLFADVSLTAMPFFRRHGFAIIRKQKKIYRGQRFSQYVMIKRL
ncbi:GNAT family N-acetyltransferase [Kaarinaea lacus]